MNSSYIAIEENKLGVIQRLLYDYPLYNYIKTKGTVNIAVIGYTSVSSKFIDVVLEVAQVDGYKVNISVFTANPEAEILYKAGRPALENFISFNHSSPEHESCGNINFVLSDSLDKDLINNILIDDEKTEYTYIFIDVHSFSENRELAVEIQECITLTDRKTNIAYVYDKEVNSDENIVSLTCDSTIQNHKDFKLLKQMSLNSHIAWDNSENTNINKIRNQFRQKYYFESSFSNVLSIKYKLYSVGLIWEDGCDFKVLAKEFSKKITNKKTLSNLVHFEHQRWCINLCCDGWQPQMDLNKCIYGIKDMVNKYHPCLVKSSDSKIRLDLPEWKDKNYQKWNKATDSEIKALDELDRVSIGLHRVFKKQADKMLDERAYPSEDIHSIRALIVEYPNTVLPFERLVMSIKSLLNGDSNSVSQYEYSRNKFKKSISVLPTRLKKVIMRYLDNINTLFFPIFESMKHKNYKRLDLTLIKAIPFILTYNTTLKIGIPLVVNKFIQTNDMLFSNIASAIRINPSRVTYFVDFSGINKTQLIDTVKYIVKGFDIHNLQTYINLFIINKSTTIDENLITELCGLSYRIKSVKFICYNKNSELKEKLSFIITKKSFNLLEETDSNVFGLLSGMGFYEMMPSFVYDSRNSVFIECNNCEFLNFIERRTHLKIADIVDLKNSSEKISLPELEKDYNYFWDFYRSNETVRGKEISWKAMCQKLGLFCNTPVMSFREKIKEDKPLSFYSYIVPQICYKSLKRLVEDLVKHKVLGVKSSIKFYNISSCRLTLECSEDVKKIFIEIFSDPYILDGNANFYLNGNKGKVFIFCDSLIVKDFNPSLVESDFGNNYDKFIISNLNKFAKKGYLLNFKEKNGAYSFSFSSLPIKQLLTKEGLLLEMYVYYNAMKTNYFDEIYSGAEFSSENNVKNEFDIILTKDFKSMIIEIKARTNLNQDMYHKLANLTNQLGINAVPIIIGDTLEREGWDNSVNDMQRNRGDEYGIKTIHKKEEIDNIGVVLKNIMKEG